jgi:uncharacterized cupredoxin-like copper-binding protein
MSISEPPDEHAIAVDDERMVRMEERLARIEDRIERGNREGRSAGRAFMIFAVGAFIVALATLIAVAAKLQAKPSSTVTVTNTAAAPATARPAPAPASRISVALREFSINPSSALGRAGGVTFAVRNAGAVTHEFVVIRTDKSAGALLKGTRADETGNVGETGELQPGEAKTIHLRLRPGHYALICNLPGHYQAGQHTDFTVR